jgi:hypothetical protein
LPAATRAQIIWFPNELRAAVIKPLRRATRTSLLYAIDHASAAAFRIFVHLAAVTEALFREEGLAAVLVERNIHADEQLSAAISRRLARRDPIAAEALREAHEWLRAILAGMVSQLRTEIALATHELAALPPLTDDEVRAELRGPSGSLLRGMVLTIAAIDVLLDNARLPSTLTQWCDLALRELQAAANSFRAAGVVIPTAVTTSLRCAAPVRAHHLSTRLLPGVLPPGVEERIVEVFAPEELWLFGSRARGTHAPGSDWDVLAVLPNDAQVTPTMTETVRRLRRERIELFLAPRAEFDEGRHVVGSLAHIATTEGFRIRGK